MPDYLLRPTPREDALFAIQRALQTRQGSELAAKIAAEVILARLEQVGLHVGYDPQRELSKPGVGPHKR